MLCGSRPSGRGASSRECRRWRHCPGAFRAMFRAARKTIDRSLAQTSAQAIDEAFTFFSRLTTLLAGLPQSAAGRALRQQLIRSQLERADRFTQLQQAQALAKKRTELRRIGAGRRQAQPASGGHAIPVQQAAFELRHPALMRSEKGTERGEQRLECRVQPAVIAQLTIELMAAAKAQCGSMRRAHLTAASGERIECGQLRHTEAARKTPARQTQHRANGAHPGAGQTRTGFLGPAQSGDRQRAE